MRGLIVNSDRRGIRPPRLDAANILEPFKGAVQKVVHAYLRIQFRSACRKNVRAGLLQQRNFFNGRFSIRRLILVANERVHVIELRQEVRNFRMNEDGRHALHELPFDQIPNPHTVVLKTDRRLQRAQFESVLLQTKLQFEIFQAAREIFVISTMLHDEGLPQEHWLLKLVLVLHPLHRQCEWNVGIPHNASRESELRIVLEREFIYHTHDHVGRSINIIVNNENKIV